MDPNPRVLVVEDDRDTLDVILFSVERLGYEVRGARSGPEALAIVAEWRPTAALLDVGLPGGMDGYELARELRKLPLAPLKLVALTGYGMDQDRERAFEAGFDAHLVKGYASLFEALGSLLGEVQGGPGH